MPTYRANAAIVLNADGKSVSAWRFTVAFVFAAGLIACGALAARRRAWLIAIACDLWFALALFWLL